MKKLLISFIIFAGAVVLLADENADFNKVMAERRADQKECSGAEPELADVGKFMKEQQALIRFPAGKKYSGDFRRGQELFKNSKKGNCYACHCGESSEIACGNIGPSLNKYRANDMEAEFVYKRIYNSWSILPCSVMPRFGIHKQLSPEEVAHIVAYLLDKKSPLNK